MLERSGFGVKVAPHAFDRRRYLAGDDEARASDLHWMFQDPEIAAIFCSRGGYGGQRLLDRIDFDLIRGNPKIFVGYSDITALLTAFYFRSGLITLHGPVLREVAEGGAENWKVLLGLLCSGRCLQVRLAEGEAIVRGRASGPLVGGNLSILCHLVGTPFLPSLDGCILFLEERGEALYRVDRMLTHLKLSGHLKSLAGLVAGQFEDCGPAASIHALLAETFADQEIPVASGLPLGHGRRNTPLPVGLPAELDTGQMTLSTVVPFPM
jgi:muramoyltetrapeptide carboxypeptidase